MGLFQQGNSWFIHFIVLKLGYLIVQQLFPGCNIWNFLFDVDCFLTQSQAAFFVSICKMLLRSFFKLLDFILLSTHHVFKFINLLSQAKFHSFNFTPFLVVEIWRIVWVKDKSPLPMLEHLDHLFSIKLPEKLKYRLPI